MSNSTKNSVILQIQRLKNSVLQFSDLPFADILSTEMLLNIVEHSSSIFTPLVTLKAFIFQVVSTDGSCRQAVSRVLSDRLRQGQSATASIRELIVMPENACLLSR